MGKSGIKYRVVEEASAKSETLKARALQLDEEAFAQELELARVQAIVASALEVEVEDGFVEKQMKQSEEMRRRADRAMQRAKVPETDMVGARRRFLMSALERVETDHARHHALAVELRSEAKTLEKESADAALAQSKEHDTAFGMSELTHGVLTERLDALPTFDPETGDLVTQNRAQRRQVGK